MIGLMFTLFFMSSRAEDKEIDRAFQKLFANAKPGDANNPTADFITQLIVAPSGKSKAQLNPTREARITDSPGSRVLVEVYYEALCPYCQAFMGSALTDVLRRPDIVSIIDLKLVPYGNTHVDGEGNFHCQHGVAECMSDIIMQCALYKLGGNISAIKDGSQSVVAWPFIHELVVKEKGHPAKAEESYKSTLGKSSAITWATIIDCYKNDANLVQNAAAEATPPHQYTAWIIVNNRHLEDGNALLSSICEAYNGAKPQSCVAATKLNVVKAGKITENLRSPFVWTEEEKRKSALSEKMAKKSYKK